MAENYYVRGKLIFRPEIGTTLKDAVEQAWLINDEFEYAKVVLAINNVDVELKKPTTIDAIQRTYRLAQRARRRHVPKHETSRFP